MIADDEFVSKFEDIFGRYGVRLDQHSWKLKKMVPPVKAILGLAKSIATFSPIKAVNHLRDLVCPLQVKSTLVETVRLTPDEQLPDAHFDPAYCSLLSVLIY